MRGRCKAGPWWAWASAAVCSGAAAAAEWSGVGWLDERTMYTTSLYCLALGAGAAAVVTAGVWIARAWRRPWVLGVAIAWTAGFGGWFQYAGLRACDRLFHAAPIYDGLGGGTMLQRMGTLAGLILAAGAATAVIVGWMARGARPAVWIAAGTLAAAGLQMAPVVMEDWVSAGVVTDGFLLFCTAMPGPLWLGVFAWAVLRAAWAERGRRSVWECGVCGYDRRGLGVGRCPECGAG